MDSDTLAGLGIVIMVLSVITFIIGFFLAIFSRKARKTGVKLLISSIVFFVIGFGTCAANFSLGGMH